MPNSFSWFIDVVNSTRISGWCFSNEAPDNPSILSFFGDKEEIGSTTANRYRQDLKALKFHPTGNCGFEHTIPDLVDLYQYDRFSIHANGSSKPLKQFETKNIPTVLREPLPKVFFMHIPKTAGTSFNTFADTLFPQNSATVHLESMDPGTYPALQSEKHYLSGHLPLREIKTHFDLTQLDLYTIIREPYGHLHSHLNWVKRIGQHPDSDFFLSHSTETQTLALLLNELDFNHEKNVHALVDGICGDLTTLFDNHQTRYFLDYKRKKVTGPDVQIAQVELGLFKAIGITEQYQQFLNQFCTAYGIVCPGQQEKLNRSESSKLFNCHDPAIRSILYPFVEFDLALYQRISHQQAKQLNP